MSEQAPIVLTRDFSTRTVHKRALMPDGGLMSMEGDNLDDAGVYAIVTEGDLHGDDPRCRRCFPQVVGEADTFTAVAEPAEDRVDL